ncbi:MAG: glutaminyl-peptide cyclotransferase [Vicinamibacterales bacterium]
MASALRRKISGEFFRLKPEATHAFTRSQARKPSVSVPVYRYKVVRSYPHDREAYTQGLLYQDGVFYEGTGLNGRSSIRKVRVETGEVLQVRALDQQYFGEGIVVWKDTLIQLTWQSGIGFIYDRETFQPRRTFTYVGEGWGLTHDGARLIMSDGSETGTLRYLDPETLRQTGKLVVRDGSRAVDELNELEFVKGEIYANVYQTNRIARISPTTGRVVGWIDLTGLLEPRDAAGADVLNGIAYDAAKDRLFVTGKLWPRVFEIQIVPR